ncbi:MAG TPA: META domain-containing protein [Nitrospirota bacterium]|nr:META domain-containing protein [Nitrospirota bacterium]
MIYYKRSSESRARRLTSISCFLFLAIFAISTIASAGDEQGPAAKDLEGITIHSSWVSSGTVTLRNGEYRGPAAPGSATETVVRLTDPRAFGQVNGKNIAAIVLVTNPGGSGMFYDLALVEMRPRGWVYDDAVLLGDRVKVHTVGIEDNEIIVSMTAHGPGDAMCCPTSEVTRRFTVQADHLVAKHEAQAGMQDPDIIGTVWQWVRTRYNDCTTMTRPDDAAGYTIQFKSDGTAEVRGDCNRGGGSFTLNSSKLSITITNTTMAACPEGSLESKFLRDLNRAGGYLIKNDRLFLNLKLDSGTMEFVKSNQNAR